MIKVTKNLSLIPEILNKENRKIAFEENLKASNYVDKNHRYRVASVQKVLQSIYHLKCAYCEKKLLDASKPIEHYRPKRGGYYWLAYSWDNLLLSCTECNTSKGNRFPIKNTKVNYTNEIFENIHTLGSTYDVLEEPYIVNPEKEDIVDKLQFDKKGKIVSNDERVQKTIYICKLNRDELAKQRENIYIDFLEDLEGHYEYYKLKKDVTRFIPTIQKFIEETKRENSFFAFRQFILENLNIFFDNKHIYKIIKRVKESNLV